MNEQRYLHVPTVAALVQRWGYLTEERLAELLRQQGTPLGDSQLRDLLWSFDFFLPAEQRWLLDPDADPDSPPEVRVTPSDGVDSAGEDLVGRLIRALQERPYSSAEELLQAMGTGVEGVEEVEAALQSGRVPALNEPRQWWVDGTQYANWFDSTGVDMVGDVHDDDDDELSDDDIDSEPDPEDDVWEFYAGPDPRNWQMEALNDWIENGERGIVEAVTGTGKTLLGVLVAARAAHYGEAVVISVPTRVLLDQWVKALTDCVPALTVGQLHQDSKDIVDEFDVLLTTAQSGSRYRLASDSRPTVLIADEVHGYGAPVRQRVLEPEFQSRLGLTATLERDNDEGVDEVLLPYFDRVVARYMYVDGLRDGVLAPFKIGFLGVDFLPDEKEQYETLGREMGRVRHRLKDLGLTAKNDKQLFTRIAHLSKDKSANFQSMRLAQKFMSNLSQRKSIQAQAANKVAAVQTLAGPLGEATRGLVFTETIESASLAAQVLDELSVPSYAYDSSYTGAERDQILSMFRTGDVSVLCAPKILDEGIDVPDADVGVIVSASRSRRQMIQRMGRIVRPNPAGHPSTFFILYVAGTREDPRRGAHEGFLEQVQPHATEVAYFEDDVEADFLTGWMLSDR